MGIQGWGGVQHALNPMQVWTDVWMNVALTSPSLCVGGTQNVLLQTGVVHLSFCATRHKCFNFSRSGSGPLRDPNPGSALSLGSSTSHWYARLPRGIHTSSSQLGSGIGRATLPSQVGVRDVHTALPRETLLLLRGIPISNSVG